MFCNLSVISLFTAKHSKWTSSKSVNSIVFVRDSSYEVSEKVLQVAGEIVYLKNEITRLKIIILHWY